MTDRKKSITDRKNPLILSKYTSLLQSYSTVERSPHGRHLYPPVGAADFRWQLCCRWYRYKLQMYWCLQTRARTRSTFCCRSATRSVPSTSTQPIRRHDLVPSVYVVIRRASCVLDLLTISASTAQFIVSWLSITNVSMSCHNVVCQLLSLLSLRHCRSLSSPSSALLFVCCCDGDNGLTKRQLHIFHALSIQFTFFSRNFLFCSLVVLDPRVDHTMDVLSPFISVLCHSTITTTTTKRFI